MKISIKEANEKYPFLGDFDRFEYLGGSIAVEIELDNMDEKILSHSLLEEHSTAAGHGAIDQTLYFARDNNLNEVRVNRVTRRITPYVFESQSMISEEDIPGSSESVREALSREDMTGVSYVVLHKRGYYHSPPGAKTRDFNDVIIAENRRKKRRSI